MSALKRILVISADAAHRDAIEAALRDRYRVEGASSLARGFELFQAQRHEVTFIDLASLAEGQGPVDYKQSLNRFFQVYPTAGLVVMCSPATLREAVAAVKAGANDYLLCPVESDEVKLIIDHFFDLRIRESELNYLWDQFWEKETLDLVRTRSPLMRGAYQKLRSVAPTKTTVLLTGETGTGKGVMAQLIHKHSNRRDRQFIGIHCGAIPDTLLESELFGHEKGAFTGATRRKLGKFEIARDGTIFLDEIASISAAAQVKLLKVLQERTYERVGGEQTLETQARIIAATNMDLKEMTEAGTFRKDLFYRFNVFPIEIPPLRERREDLPLLAELFVQRLNQFYNKEITGVHPAVLRAFEAYDWPGNIRELENLIERAYILETSKLLTPESFPGELFSVAPVAQLPMNASHTLAEVRRRGIEHIERQYLKELLTAHRGRIKDSAAQAGITTRQLHKLLTRYHIHKEDYKN
jgi:DNA-binding NtrC family response regulator